MIIAVEPVEHHAGPAALAGFNGLRHAQLGVRVLPTVRPDADFLLGVQVVQRDGARQAPFPDRRIETGVVQIAAPALLLTIEATLQGQLAGDRLAVNLQLQLVLLLAAFGVEGQQADLQRILLQLFDAYR